MKKRLTALLLSALLLTSLLTACGAPAAEKPETDTAVSAAVPETVSETTDTVGETTQTPVDTVPPETDAPALPDGIYTVDFDTDSGMFHVNEACEGKGVLTVAGGTMNVHISLVSKSIVNLYVGKSEDAAKEGAVLLQPTEDPVKYKDGYEETVFGFDVPVEALDTDFDLAIIGKKGTWYDHTVRVSNPVPVE